MNFLFVSLLNPRSSSHKGDFKLLHQRATVLLNSGHSVTLTFFKPSFLCFSPSIQYSQKALDPNINILTINLPIISLFVGFLLLTPIHFAERKPIQTLLSRVYSLLSQSLLDNLYKSYYSVHFFHVRSSYFFRHSNSVPHPVYELIDSYALNLSRRVLLASSSLSRLLYYYEAAAIEAEEYNIINHNPAAQVLFVSHLDAQHYTTEPDRSPISIPLYTQLYNFKQPLYSPGRPLNLGFFGNLNYHPNVYAVRSLIDLSTYNQSLVNPLPLRFHVGGRFLPTHLRRELANTSFNVISPIPSITEFLHQIDVCIFFMRAGSGMQSKLLEAASNSCVIITSQQPFDAIFSNPTHRSIGQAGFVASDITEVHSHLRAIFTGTIPLSPIAANAYSYIREYYSLTAVSRQYLKSLVY